MFFPAEPETSSHYNVHPHGGYYLMDVLIDIDRQMDMPHHPERDRQVLSNPDDQEQYKCLIIHDDK